jgi:hypothetical protein
MQNRIDGQTPQSRQRKHTFRDHGPADEQGEADADDGHDR